MNREKKNLTATGDKAEGIHNEWAFSKDAPDAMGLEGFDGLKDVPELFNAETVEALEFDELDGMELLDSDDAADILGEACGEMRGLPE